MPSSSSSSSSDEALSLSLNSVILNSQCNSSSAEAEAEAAAAGAAHDPSLLTNLSAHHQPFPPLPSPISPSASIFTNSSADDRHPAALHSSSSSSAMASNTISLIWFRNDLRIHDNEALMEANSESAFLVPVYCFDPRDFGKSVSMGVDKTGPYRSLFLIDCVANLRQNLQKRGSELVLRIGEAEEEIVGIAKAVGASAVYAHEEVSHEEFEMEKTVAERLGRAGMEARFVWGGTLLHKDDLPFQLQDMPSSYCEFRTRLRNVQVRAVFDSPEELKPLPPQFALPLGDLPTLQDLGLPCVLDKQNADVTNEPLIHGGETEALRIINSIDVLLINSKDKEMPNDVGTLSGINPTWNVSPWLATGCLSPRRMLLELKEKCSRANMKVSEEGFQHNVFDCLLVELLWKDFFRFVTKKYVSYQRLSSSSKE